ncbi:MAG: lipoyl(octanoyl) transferase LipB [Candidatus Endonucleobacter bathymodioli]|uniref:Octanoyltransferase n=1 Tax=Candidatus Endonucleibacter bathymodioli TaxID=539814 RepID=A0AA90NUU0_9GAMM|nr:lipoyl(octanoyl) transferase LipB [Candidatus Endonucleobacter bathymodioli]
MSHSLFVCQLGRQSYHPVWQAMKDFTDKRDASTPDEVWFVEHNSVFTLGQAGKLEHVLAPGDIPVIKVDRGGQVTYHGPGQMVMYLLVDARRAGCGPRRLVTTLENSAISLLSRYNIEAYSKPEAPGVYVNNAKIACLGLRFRKMCSYHGLSINVDMDLEPFQRINPCGYAGQPMTSIKEFYPNVIMTNVAKVMLECLMEELGTCSTYYCSNISTVIKETKEWQWHDAFIY